MLRSIVTLICFILLIVGCWWLWTEVAGPSKTFKSGVYKADGSTTDASGNEVHPTTSRSDAPGTINTEPTPEYSSPANNQGDTSAKTDSSSATTTYNTQSSTAGYNNPSTNGYNNGNSTTQPTPSYASPSSAYSQPYDQQQPYARTASTDSLPASAPNGYAYSGSGAYELYRQGDLTYRMDTKSGASCVLYATMEQWSKPIVFSHGCGSRWWLSRHRR